MTTNNEHGRDAASRSAEGSREAERYTSPKAEDIDTTHDPAEAVAIIGYGQLGTEESDRWH